MATNNNLGDLLTAIADAIRAKKKTSLSINAQDFPSEIANLPSRNEYGNDGTVDAAGLAELGWNANDIAWLQKVCWWDAEDNEKWKVSDANKAFGPNGATPITWDNLSTFAGNTDIVFFPKLANTSYNYVNITLPNLLAIPTDGWSYFNTGGYNQWLFKYNPQLISVGDLNDVQIFVLYAGGAFCQARNLRFKDWFKPNSARFGRYSFGGAGDGQDGTCNGFERLDLTNLNFHTGAGITDIFNWFKNSAVREIRFNIWGMSTDYGMFDFCPRLREVYVNEITKSWTFAGCPNLSRESCLRIFDALSESETGTITLEAQVKARLSAEDIAIATDKGWTIA